MHSLSVHGRLLWANKHHPRKKAFSYNSFESFNDISCIFEHWKATVALWKIMTTMIEVKDVKQGTKDPKSQQHSTRKRWRQQQQRNLHLLPFLSELQLLLSDIVQISCIQTGFLLCFIISSRFNSVELSPTYSHSTLPLAFCVHSCKYSEHSLSLNY